MTENRDPLADLVDSVSEGKAVDWDSAARRTNPADRARVEALRDVSRIAAFSRSLQHVSEPRKRETAGAAMPDTWGDLLVLESIGAGPRANVYRAWDPTLQRDVALKLFHAGGAVQDRLEAIRRGSSLRHANLISMHGIEERDGIVGLWMDFVRGTTLDQEVRIHGPLDPTEIARLGIEIGSALAAVHGAGLVHGGISPTSVTRDVEKRHALGDLGMQPQSDQSDIEALGNILWFALAGKLPEAESPLPPVRPEAPVGLVVLIERAMGSRSHPPCASAQQCVDLLSAWRLSSMPNRTTWTSSLRNWIRRRLSHL